MRSLADLQRAPGTSPPEQPPALPINVERVRTFDTPEFAGMQFLEVETKTALNRVQGMPFSWSINPYRGCSHACAYCVVGETPVLMADGRTKPIAEIRPGDQVHGTQRRGRYRRYVVTPVLDHWSTQEPAYRITLEDGTQLIASGDHRFLSNRGWKHVSGAEQGTNRRPHLTLNNKLIGVGGFADPPKQTPGYRRGYLCGMIRGDANLGSYSYHRQGRSHEALEHRFRLALVDDEALGRTVEFLLDEDIPPTRLRFSEPTAERKGLNVIRASSRGAVERISDLIEWPRHPSEAWCKGFLAGIFDAEGSYGQHVIRIHNTDEEIIAHVTGCLRRLGFTFTLEQRVARPCPSVRLHGGIREALRFFHTVDPAITRKRSIEGMALKSDAALRIISIEGLGIGLPMYDITTGTGDFIANGVVSHNCFARPSHSYLNMSPLGEFERKVVVKPNIVDVLRRELARPSWNGEHVAMGTNTDPYQRCEGRYRLMPGIIAALAEYGTPFSILTKGALIIRDLDGLLAAAERVPVSAAFTVGMLDEALWREVEPGTPPPRARLDAVRALNEAGIPTGVMLAPVMPGLNDDREQLAELVEQAAAAGATNITPIVLHLRRGKGGSSGPPRWMSVREVFWPWLTEHHPELVERYKRLYRGSQAPRSYRDEIASFVAERRAAAWRRHGRPPAPAWRGGSGAQPKRGDASFGEQLSLLEQPESPKTGDR